MELYAKMCVQMQSMVLNRLHHPSGVWNILYIHVLLSNEIQCSFAVTKFLKVCIIKKNKTKTSLLCFFLSNEILFYLCQPKKKKTRKKRILNLYIRYPRGFLYPFWLQLTKERFELVLCEYTYIHYVKSSKCKNISLCK